MALSQEELQSVVNAVLSSIRTNSKTIGQLTPAISINGDDCFEIDGGKKVPLSLLKELLVPSSYPDNTDALLHVIRAGFRAIGAAFWDSNEPFPSGNAVIDSSRLGLAAVNGNVCLYLASNIGKVLPVSFNYRNGGEAATGSIPANGNTMIVLDGSRFSGNDNIVVNVGSLDALGGGPYYIGMVAISENSTPALRGNFTQLQKRVTNVEEEVMSQGGDIAELQRFIEEVNVSKIYPTGGIDGTNKYTLETAIAKIPASLRNVGIKCSFINEANQLETWEYIGNTFTSVNNWARIGAIQSVLFDVSAEFPTGGIDGTDNYTIETAIHKVPSTIQLYVRYLTFKVSDTERELWQFNAIRTTSVSQFMSVDNWYKMRVGMYHSVSWGQSANMTRCAVPKGERQTGMIISYTNGDDELVYELYTGKPNLSNVADYYDNFTTLYVASQIDEIVAKNTRPIYVTGDFANSIKELYIDKYEEGAIYQIKRLVLSSDYPNGLIWINKQGDSTDYAVVNKNNLGGLAAGIVEVASNDGTFHAYLIIDWSNIIYGYNQSITMVIQDAAKVMENSPAIYAKLSISPVAQNAEIGAGLESRLYNETETTVFEDLEEQAGNTDYGYNNIGLIHQAKTQETFNAVRLGLLRKNAQAVTTGSLIVKQGTAVSANGGTIIKQVDNFSNSELPNSGLYEIQLGKDVTLEPGEYFWVYYTGNNVTIRAWDVNNEEGTRTGMYFQGKLNTYRYSTAMTLFQGKGDLITLDERVSAIEEELGTGENDGKVTTPMITLPTDLYVVTGREQTFYYNEFIYGVESNQDNTLLNYNISARVSPQGMGSKCLITKEGFTIYTKTPGDYTITISIFDQFNNLLIDKATTLHVVDATAVSGKSILMLGDSWTDINSGDKGYTSYVDKALKEIGITMNFIGTRDAGTSGLKHEGIGGYAYTTFVNAPSTVRFKFFVDEMPSISSDDIYSNNGSTYKLFERGSNYLTMSRQSGSTEPSGDTLTRTSGTGDETITFTSWTVGGSNPLWNTVTNELDFTHYRQDLCGLSTKLDICNIQLGVNDSMGSVKTTKTDWEETLSAVTTLVDAILADSPNCKIILNLAGLDCPSPTGWASLNGFPSSDPKRNYQINNYYLRTYINELIEARGDYKTNVFIGQSVMGINRWYGYGYTDRRYRYFKISESMSEGDLTKLKNFDFQQRSVYTYTDDTNEEFQAYFYDARGYLVCRCEQKHANWNNHEQEFVNAQSVPQDTVPAAGNLTKGGGSASVDFPVVPYTDCFIENNNSKEHWFMNATHPYDLGYRQMAYCVAHQIAALLVE